MNQEALMLFDDIYMIRLADENILSNAPTIMNDPNLMTEVVNAGLEPPTSMAFLGPDDIPVLERNIGEYRIWMLARMVTCTFCLLVRVRYIK
jgi:hypothetical protein